MYGGDGAQMTRSGEMSEEAYLSEPSHSFGEYWQALKRRKWVWFISAGVLLTIALAVAALWPPSYRSFATILIERQEIPQDFVRTTVTTFADQRLAAIRQQVMTTANLIQVINKYDLYAEERAKHPIEQVVRDMSEAIGMDTVSAEVLDPRTGRASEVTIAFTVSYRHESPTVAQRVANELTSLYLNENLKARTQLTEQTSKFLSDEADKLSKIVSELEGALAGFKETHGENLPEYAEINRQQAARAEVQLEDVARQIQSLEEREIYLNTELAQLEPTLVQRDSPQARVGERSAMHLGELRNEYVRLSTRYSANHPDVKRITSEIRAMEAELGDVGADALEERLLVLQNRRAVVRQKYSPSHPEVRGIERSIKAVRTMMANVSSQPQPVSGETIRENPAYVQVRTQLKIALLDLAGLRNKRAELERKVRESSEKMAVSPQVERQYRALMRDHENALQKYREIKAKEIEASIAQSLETDQKGERFTLIQPPLLPEQPISPNRLAIVFLGLVASVGGGTGSVMLAEVMDTTLRGRKGHSRMFAEPPLATIPRLVSPAERRWRRVRSILIALGIALLIATVLFVVHSQYMPLDVLWFRVLGKFDLAY